MEFNEAVWLYIFSIIILVGVLIATYFGIQAFVLKTGKGKSLLRPMFRRKRNE